jgi:hypothetical protein
MLNLAGLALTWLLLGFRLGPGGWLFVALCTAAGGTALGFWLNPEIGYSVGASGLLHGLLAAGCLAEIRTGGRMGYLLAAILAAKIATEQLTGAVSSDWLAAPVNLAAHWHGAAAGAAAWALLLGYSLLRRRR